MGIKRRGRLAWRGRPAMVTSIALLAAGALAGISAAVMPAAASASSSQFSYACGSSFSPGQARCLLIKDTAAQPAVSTVSPEVVPSGTGYTPANLQAAYGLTSASAADGAGETVAVIDAYDDPSAASDLAAYRSAAGLPALTSGQFNEYNQNGDTTPLPAAAPASAAGDWTEETSLDLDMVSAICPLCTIDLVEANNATAVNMLLADLAAATSLGARYISNSWGFTEVSADTVLDSAVFSVPGVVFVAGAGESGAGDVVYPAASPDVVSVGGTTLATSSSTRGYTESVWYTPASGGSPAIGTGSGCSAFEPQPSWQTSVSGIATACHNRVQNDVAADADPSTGVAVYDTSDGNTGWFEAGGTSEAAPIIAAVFALAGNDGNGGSNAAKSIYTNTSDLNEVTAGTNGTCTPSILCTATGAANAYNGPTGWGTPNGIAAFASIGNEITVAFPGDQTGTVGTAISGVPISGTDAASGQTLSYTATGLPPGLSISSAGQITGTPTTAGAYEVTVTAADTTGAAGSATFIWLISPVPGSGSSASPSAGLAGSASAIATCAPSASDSATASASSSATASASPSATASASPSASSTSSAQVQLAAVAPEISDCSASVGPTTFASGTGAPAASASSSSSASTPAPTPSAVSSSLAVTG